MAASVSSSPCPAWSKARRISSLSVVPTGEAPHGALVSVRAGYSRSKDCMVFSISSAAMSEVDWMPWILSLNSSGLLARRSASS